MKIAFYFLISAALLSAARADDQLPNPVVAKGKNFEFRQSDLDEAFIAFRANIAALGERIPEGTRSTLEAQLLDEMIFTRLLVDKSNDADRAKARETANELLDKVRSRSSSEDIFRMRLRALGLSVEQFEKQVVDQALRREVLRRLMSADIRITDEQIRSYYETNTAQFSEPEKVRASHILLATVNKETRQPVSPDIRKEKETTIRKLKERAESGEDFARLAKEFSEDPGSKDKGGEYTFGRGEMVKPFEAAAFSLEPGQISDVVETQFGFHIIKVHEKIPARTKPLSDVSATLKEHLLEMEIRRRMPEFYESLKKEAGVEVLLVKE